MGIEKAISPGACGCKRPRCKECGKCSRCGCNHDGISVTEKLGRKRGGQRGARKGSFRSNGIDLKRSLRSSKHGLRRNRDICSDKSEISSSQENTFSGKGGNGCVKEEQLSALLEQQISESKRATPKEIEKLFGWKVGTISKKLPRRMCRENLESLKMMKEKDWSRMVNVLIRMNVELARNICPANPGKLLRELSCKTAEKYLQSS